jgi:hypothetical protein
VIDGATDKSGQLIDGKPPGKAIVNMLFDQVLVTDRLGGLDVLAHRFEDRRLDLIPLPKKPASPYLPRRRVQPAFGFLRRMRCSHGLTKAGCELHKVVLRADTTRMVAAAGAPVEAKRSKLFVGTGGATRMRC